MLISAGLANAQRVELFKIHATGDAVPNHTDLSFASFGRPSNAEFTANSFCFAASLTGAAVTPDTDTALFLQNAIVLTSRFREGTPVPNLPEGVVFAGIERSQASTAPIALVRLRGPGITTDNDRVLIRANSTNQILLRTGTPISALPTGVTISDIGSWASSNSMSLVHVRLVGASVTTSNDQAMLVVNSSGVVTLAARTGSQATPANSSVPATTFLDLSAMPPLIHSSSASGAFHARLSYPFPDITHNRAFFSVNASGARTTLGQTLDPTLPFAGPFSNPAADTFCYTSGSLGNFFTEYFPSTGSAPPARLWYSGTQIGAGQSVTGLSGVRIAGFPTSPSFTRASSGLFVTARLTGTGVTSTNDLAIFAPFIQPTPLLARTGDRAPGTPPGVTFADFAPVLLVSDSTPTRVIFRARLTGPGVLPENDEALFVGFNYADRATVALIVREGEPFSLAPGDARTVASIYPTLGWNDEPFDAEPYQQGGRASPLSLAGELVTRLTFTDGTQAIAGTLLYCLSTAGNTAPPDQTALKHSTVTLAANVARVNGQTCIWQRNGVNLSDGAFLSGTRTPTLTILRVGASDEGVYTLRFGNCVNSNTTQTVSATLTVVECRVDVNYDGARTIDDVFDFLNIWFRSSPLADFDASGAVTIDDIFVYLEAWFAGC